MYAEADRTQASIEQNRCHSVASAVQIGSGSFHHPHAVTADEAGSGFSVEKWKFALNGPKKSMNYSRTHENGLKSCSFHLWPWFACSGPFDTASSVLPALGTVWLCLALSTLHFSHCGSFAYLVASTLKLDQMASRAMKLCSRHLSVYFSFTPSGGRIGPWKNERNSFKYRSIHSVRASLFLPFEWSSVMKRCCQRHLADTFFPNATYRSNPS